MAERLVALLRGVNVGRANRVAMGDLRDLLADLGYSDVSTLRNSGNAVFSAPGVATPAYTAERIREALAERLGLRVPVVVVSAPELTVAIARNPLAEIAGDPARLVVAFLSDPADRSRLIEMTERDWAPEVFAVGERVAYLWCPAGVARSPLSRALGQILGDAVTTRNWTTVLRLRGLAEDIPR